MNEVESQELAFWRLLVMKRWRRGLIREALEFIRRSEDGRSERLDRGGIRLRLRMLTSTVGCLEANVAAGCNASFEQNGVSFICSFVALSVCCRFEMTDVAAAI